jgi:hypothetical protein
MRTSSAIISPIITVASLSNPMLNVWSLIHWHDGDVPINIPYIDKSMTSSHDDNERGQAALSGSLPIHTRKRGQWFVKYNSSNRIRDGPGVLVGVSKDTTSCVRLSENRIDVIADGETFTPLLDDDDEDVEDTPVLLSLLVLLLLLILVLLLESLLLTPLDDEDEEDDDSLPKVLLSLTEEEDSPVDDDDTDDD